MMAVTLSDRTISVVTDEPTLAFTTSDEGTIHPGGHGSNILFILALVAFKSPQ